MLQDAFEIKAIELSKADWSRVLRIIQTEYSNLLQEQSVIEVANSSRLKDAAAILQLFKAIEGQMI